jgi:predicted RNA binding protein YcfA (HicA-like mRNA interferase family)
MKYRDLIKMLNEDGWQHIRTTGSHFHFKHPTKPGLVTVPSGGKLSHDIPTGNIAFHSSPGWTKIVSWTR